MRVIRVCLASLAFVFFLVSPLMASCRWEWLCDEWGRCVQAPICDSAYDIPPPRPPGVQPIVSPSLRPTLPPTELPPDARSCNQVRRCNSVGICFWDTVCQ